MHYSILLNEEQRIHKTVSKRLSILNRKNVQLPKQQNKSTQSQFYSPRQATQNTSTYDQMFNQLSHHKKSTVAQIITELKKPPPQITYNLILPKLDKTQIKDKNKLQDMLRTYCTQQSKQNQKISSVHKVRLNTQSEFQLFEALDHIDENMEQMRRIYLEIHQELRKQ
ncbi:hypothetical protein pb186bvf_019291 [Paramecium bursaria]